MPPRTIDRPCARCGYDLRGIADHHACPECGLLAERSRAGSDDLYDASPRWLLCVSIGTTLIVLAQVFVVIWFFHIPPQYRSFLLGLSGIASEDNVTLAGFDVMATMLAAGVWLITLKPTRAPRAGSDQLLCWTCRAAGTLPLLTLVVLHVAMTWFRFFPASPTSVLIILVTLGVGGAPLPTLVFLQLRRLAQRHINPNLLRHAMFVGIGFSLALIGVPLTTVVLASGVGGQSRGAAVISLAIVLIETAALLLSAITGAVICVMFVAAFVRAYRGATRKWSAADRAITH